MYADTTPYQLVRAVGVWVLGIGLITSPFTLGSVRAGDTAGMVFGFSVIGLGAAMVLGGKAIVAALDKRNRPFLMGPLGRSILPRRKRFFTRLTTIKRIALWTFLSLGSAFIVLVSAYNCEDQGRGFCAAVSQPSDATLLGVQLFTLGIGAFYVAGVILSRTHEGETERLELIIAEGQRRRRDDDPLAGISGRGWE